MSRSWVPAKNALREEVGSEAFSDLAPSTVALSSRLAEREGGWRPLVTPIFHSSTYIHDSVNAYLHNIRTEGYIYQRLGNPTCEAAEVVINEMEGGEGSLVYASGMDAISSLLLAFLKAGDHIICQNPCYSGTFEFIKNTLVKFGVQVSWARVDGSKEEWASLIRPNTRIIYGETPSNPTLALLDLDMLAELGGLGKNILTVVDGTFASPHAIQPIKHGIDFSVHSCTKYMGGHSDLVAGCVTVRSQLHWKALKVQMAASGGCLAPHEAAVLHRGLKTLPLRLERHSAVASQVAAFLEGHHKVKQVLYPGLDSHPQRELARRQMRVPGGMMAFEVESLEAALRLSESLRLVNLAVSLGGAESLITIPAATTHGPMLMSDEERQSYGIGPGLLRFSVGLEEAKDLIEDLAKALDAS